MENSNEKFDAVIFDMDGTLIDSRLDFAAIRSSIGITDSTGVLEHIKALPAKDRQQAEKVLLSYELAAAENAALIDGAENLIRTLKAAGVPIALLTRNTRMAFDVAAENFTVMKLFDHVRCREDGVIKPEADGILNVCKALNVSPAKTLCVGDFEYDMIAAHNAGAIGVLLKTYPKWENFVHHADFVIDRLDELLRFFDL